MLKMTRRSKPCLTVASVLIFTHATCMMCAHKSVFLRTSTRLALHGVCARSSTLDAVHKETTPTECQPHASGTASQNNLYSVARQTIFTRARTGSFTTNVESNKKQTDSLRLELDAFQHEKNRLLQISQFCVCPSCVVCPVVGVAVCPLYVLWVVCVCVCVCVSYVCPLVLCVRWYWCIAMTPVCNRPTC